MAKKGSPSARPDGIDDHVERRSSLHHHADTLSLLVLGGIVLWGLSGFAGSRTHEHAADASALKLSVTTPSLIRNGELYETTIDVAARRRIGKLVIGVTPALWRETTVNSMTPAPADESSEGGLFRFVYGPVKAGDSFQVKIDLQINPSLFGDNAGRVVAFDGDERLAEVPLRLRVLP
jgi:hypothetical protein